MPPTSTPDDTPIEILQTGPRGADVRERFAREIATVSGVPAVEDAVRSLVALLEEHEGTAVFRHMPDEYLAGLRERPEVLKRLALACVMRELIGNGNYREVDAVIEQAGLSGEEVEPVARESLAIVRGYGADERWKEDVVQKIILQFPRLHLS